MSVMKSEGNMSEKVYNISSRIGKAKAFFKGVKETPARIIENHKIFGEIMEKKLSSLL